MPHPKQLTQHRSRLRWRLSYLTLALLGLWSAGTMAASVVASEAEIVQGFRWLLSSRISVVALIRQSWLGGLSLLLFAMALTIWQIYQVGAQPSHDAPPRRSPARAPARSAGRSLTRSAPHPRTRARS